MMNIPIVKAATAYNDPQTGETYILILAQALFLGDKLEHSLICLNQVHAHGVVVDDVPIHLMQDKQAMHSIYFPEEQTQLPLKMCGCSSHLNLFAFGS